MENNFDLDKFYEFVDKIQEVIANENFKYAYFAFCAIFYDAYQQGILTDEALEDFPKYTKEIGDYFEFETKL